MKHLLTVLLALPTLATAQSIDRHVAASSGNEYSTSAGSMAYTIGEPLTNTLVGGTAIFTQGLPSGHHQHYLRAAAIALGRHKRVPQPNSKCGAGAVWW